MKSPRPWPGIPWPKDTASLLLPTHLVLRKKLKIMFAHPFRISGRKCPGDFNCTFLLCARTHSAALPTASSSRLVNENLSRDERLQLDSNLIHLSFSIPRVWIVQQERRENKKPGRTRQQRLNGKWLRLRH